MCLAKTRENLEVIKFEHEDDALENSDLNPECSAKEMESL
jgi:hypothetical protein